MKLHVKYFALSFITLSICLNSCGKIEEIDLIEESVEEQSQEVGFLNLKAQLQKEIKVSSGRIPPLDEVLDNLIVEIWTSDLEFNYTPIINSNYRDLPELIELGTGGYHIEMYSSSFNANINTSRFDNPDYGWVSDFIIEAGANTEINAALELLDTAVTIDFTNELLTEFPDITVNADVSYTNGAAYEIWTSTDDERTAYFSMTERMSFATGESRLTGISESLFIQISSGSSYISRSYPNIMANQHYQITLSYSGDSTASLTITLGDRDIIVEEIPFPG